LSQWIWPIFDPLRAWSPCLLVLSELFEVWRCNWMDGARAVRFMAERIGVASTRSELNASGRWWKCGFGGPFVAGSRNPRLGRWRPVSAILANLRNVVTWLRRLACLPGGVGPSRAGRAWSEPARLSAAWGSDPKNGFNRDRLLGAVWGPFWEELGFWENRVGGCERQQPVYACGGTSS